MADALLAPMQLGDIPLANRIVMAPMTRDRAGPGDVPTDLHGATEGMLVMTTTSWFNHI